MVAAMEAQVSLEKNQRSRVRFCLTFPSKGLSVEGDEKVCSSYLPESFNERGEVSLQSEVA